MSNKTSYDQETVRQVRNKTLTEIQAILNQEPRAKKFSKVKIDMLMRLAPTAMPRVNEHSGIEGAPLKVSFDNAFTSQTE